MATVDAPIRVSIADNGRRMTLEEFLECEEEEGYRYELARGVLEVTEVPNDPHGFFVCNLMRMVALYDHAHPGRILRFGEASGFRLWLPGMISGRNPDFTIVLAGATKGLRGRRRPAIAFEVVSPGGEARHRDYVTKREEYLVYGLLEYWIIDPIEHKVTVLIRDGDVWVERAFVDGQNAEGVALPGFAVPVADLWAIPPDEDDGPLEA